MKRQPDNSGFTLIEVLVVIMVVVILVSILAPSIIQVKRQIGRGVTQSTINMLDIGCKMYADDFKVYPDSPGVYPDSTPATIGGVSMEGRHRLVQSLTGYMIVLVDGKDGYGFRTGGRRGTVHGPYNGAENIKATAASPLAFVDSFGGEIYYYCGYPGGNPNPPPSGPVQRDPATPFVDGDNTDGPEDDDSNPAVNEYIKDGATILRSDYIIISRGPNKTWDRPAVTDPKSDDVTNFSGK